MNSNFKHFSRYLAEKFKIPKFSKGHNSGKIWQNFFKIESGNLLTIPYQLTRIEAPSSNGFQDILLTSLKSPNFQRALILEKS